MMSVMVRVMVRVVVMSSDVHDPVAEFLYANQPGRVNVPMGWAGWCPDL